MTTMLRAKTIVAFALLCGLCGCAETPKPEAMVSPAPMSRPAQSPGLQRAVANPPTSRPAVRQDILPGTLRDFEVNVGDRVLFAFDQSNLDDASRATLQKQAAWLSKYPLILVTIQGNADERGTREYNLALGARRANAVRDYLVSLGVVGDRLTTISYGKERPVCGESNETCWSKNRRAVSAITNAPVYPDNVAMGR
jgi:peptidoglycan-associated lipoprotein